MRIWHGAVAALSIATASCSLVVSLDELRGPDAGATDAAPDVATNDAAGDVTQSEAGGDAGSGPTASWTFDEDGGTIAHDVTGHGHDGTINGGTWVAGHSGSAILLNGTSQFISVPASSAFDKPSGASFTITAWVQRVGTFMHHIVLSISFGPTSAMYGLEAQSNTLMNYWDGVSHIATTTVDFGTSVWHHMGVVVDNGTNAHLYFDGNEVGLSTAADNSARVCTGVMIGASNFGDFFPGALDNVRFWNRALSAAEVGADMNQ